MFTVQNDLFLYLYNKVEMWNVCYKYLATYFQLCIYLKLGHVILKRKRGKEKERERNKWWQYDTIAIFMLWNIFGWIPLDGFIFLSWNWFSLPCIESIYALNENSFTWFWKENFWVVGWRFNYWYWLLNRIYNELWDIHYHYKVDILNGIVLSWMIYCKYLTEYITAIRIDRIRIIDRHLCQTYWLENLAIYCTFHR